MRHPHRVVLLALVVSLPSLAAADWRGPGGLEPDSEVDRTWGAMYEGPPGANAAIYFQGFAAVPETSLSPNPALLGSRILPAPALHHRAILGVWTDCNGDGYIGLAESALQDYAAQLLLDDSACPAQLASEDPVHNDGQWVNEFLAIGMVDPCEHETDPIREAFCPGVDAFAENERVHYADGTFVWADIGLPGSIPTTECILAPLPSGTTSGTGAMFGWADCQSRRGLADAVNEADPDGALGLRFEDAAHPEDSSSLLNQRFPITLFATATQPGALEDDTDASSATVWDCSSAPVTSVDDPEGPREIVLADPSGGSLDSRAFPFVIVYTLTGVGFRDGEIRMQLTDDDGTYATVPSLAPEAHDPAASSWVAAERALDGPAGDCDPASDSALAGAYPGATVESDASPILEARKDRTSATFTFYDGHRGFHTSIDPHTGPLAPSDGGTMLLDHGRGGDGPMWSALAQSDQDPQLVNREDLGFTSARYVTYYAHLGPGIVAAGHARPSDGVFTYGALNCEGADSGLHRGWACDTDLWWKDANGNDNTPRYAQGLRIGRLPGDLFHMIDVDCYDGEVARGTGLHASAVDLTEEGGCP